MVAGTGTKFLLLFWKNWIIQKRKICCTITEILIPVVLSLLLLALRQAVSAKDKDAKTWPEFSVEEFPPGLSPPMNGSAWKLAYTPNTALTQTLIGFVADQLDLDITDMGYNSEGSLRKDLIQETDEAAQILGGIVFQGLPSTDDMPHKIKYKIRLSSLDRNCGRDICPRNNDADNAEWNTERQFSEEIYLGPRNADEADGGDLPGYYRQGFLTLQRAVDRAIMLAHNVSEADVDQISVMLQRHPYPEYLEDAFIFVLQGQFPLFIMLIYLCTVPLITKDIVLEKERKLKETMKLMGMPGWLHWAAWFCKYFTFLMINVIVMTVFYSLDFGSGAVVNKMDPSLLLVFFIIYTISVILFCFAVSVFFSSANTAAAASGILFFVTYSVYFFFDFNYYGISLSAKLGASLLPNVAMAFCCVLIALQEAAGVGMQWSNFYEPVNVNDDLTLLYMFMVLLLDCFICIIIIWYVEAIKPGDFGVPLPWYFPFTKWYWCGSNPPADEEADMNVNMDTKQHEYLTEGLKSGIQIRGLRKVFNARSKTPRVAVDNLNLDMVEGQITALLGHNGAGKTTTMFMLTGFLEPTKGNALIGGYDIRKNLSKVRENLGLCPQHDVLFDVLTVREHLEFFGRLKACKDLDKEVNDMIELLHLEDKTHRQARTLSGGMKRKLCVGIALIGGSKVIVLDEPTSGMDPEARRQTWDILQKARRGRTMLLTTHFMDEADYLGDRIAIMSHGKLVCSGSSLFLKKRYGVGYHMNMVKKDGCDSRRVEELVKKHVPDAGLESDAGAELSFVLPHESSNRFEELFNTIEAHKAELGINSWGASVTTMEEVFLKVGNDELEEDRLINDAVTRLRVGEEGLKNDKDDSGVGETENGKQHGANGMDNPSYNGADAGNQQIRFKDERVHINMPDSNHRNGKHYNFTPTSGSPSGGFTTDIELNGGLTLWVQQFWAMFVKRVLNSWRSPIVSIVQLTIPFIFALLGCIVKETLPDTGADPKSLKFDFDKFSDPLGVYKGVGNGRDMDIASLTDRYTDFLEDESVKLTEVTRGDSYAAVEDFLLKESDDDLQTYINDHIVGGYFDGNYTNSTLLARGLFNNEALHSPAFTLTAISNAVLRYLTGNDDMTIVTTNHPLPLPASFQAEEDLAQAAEVAFIIAFNTGFGMAFLVATFVVFLINERHVKAKHCQYTSGVPVPLFWLGTYVWDILNFLVPCIAILILFVAFDIEGYVEGDNLGVTFMLFLFYGFSVLPFVYLISFVFDVAATGYVVVLVINIITGTVASVSVFILKVFNTDTTKDIADALEWAFYVLLPNFCFSNGLQELYNNYNAKETCERHEKLIEDNLEASGLSGEFATFQFYCDHYTDGDACCEDNCGDSCTEYVSNDLAWSSPGIGRAILFMFLQAIAYFAIIFFLESGISKRFYNFCMSSYTQARVGSERYVVSQQGPTGAPMMAGAPQGAQAGAVNQGYSANGMQAGAPPMAAGGPSHAILMRALSQTEDDDVASERQRVDSAEISTLVQQESIVLRGLTKYYGGFKAVDSLSIGIRQGECFGLLGVNGAGKTTTFKMLTGDETVSGGEAYVKGCNVASNIKEVQRRVGYCPQFDALIDKLTVKETLTMFARLRGVKEKQISDEVDILIRKLLLADYSSKLAGNLSGGNKRKLSTAIALVGGPPIVFLDEPTTGMDPVARRQLWNTLVQVTEAGRTIVLTSHSMEECEALCTRLVIMVNGQFKCTGSSQHLKDKFGEGYALMAKVTPGTHQGETQDRTFAMMNFIEQTFPGCVLKDSHPGLVLYQISSANTSLAQVFGIMERNKDALHIEDYSVSQTTLEQVFINFARAQRPPLDEAGATCACCHMFCCCQD